MISNELLNKLPRELKNSCDILKNTSYDHKNDIYMTDSEIQVFDFDKVKDSYIKNNLNNVNPNPKSNDALYVTNEGKWIFIEFKNGEIDNLVNFEINKKIYDSIAILFDLMVDKNEVDFKSSISFSRRNIDYMLVYNVDKYDEKKQTSLTKQGISRQNSRLQNSKSRDLLKKSVMKLSKQNFILFGLDQFKGYFFENVFTYSIDEFEENFVKRHNIGLE